MTLARKNPVACVVYIHAKEEAYLQRSLAVMIEHDWVGRVIVLDTDIDAAPAETGKLLRVGIDFGTDIGKPVEEGGLDQIAAREKSLELGRETGFKWLVVCDADEFYTDSLQIHLSAAEQAGCNAIRLPIYPYCSPDKYLSDEGFEMESDGNAYPKPMPRIVTADCPAKYVRNMTPHLASPNKTRHCFLSRAGPGIHWYVALDPPCCIHTHWLLYPKRPPDSYIGRLRRKDAWPELLPEVMMNAWNKQCNSSNV